jgi:hypothetical protein
VKRAAQISAQIAYSGLADVLSAGVRFWASGCPHHRNRLLTDLIFNVELAKSLCRCGAKCSAGLWRGSILNPWKVFRSISELFDCAARLTCHTVHLISSERPVQLGLLLERLTAYYILHATVACRPFAY